MFVISLSIISGCGATYNKQINQEVEIAQPKDKIEVEAYLFDAKLKQKGKPTSVRLFFFQTDSVIAIGGKGYLGKGALKGWMNNDSILMIFPTMKEYLYEPIYNLFSSFNCSGDIPKFPIMSLFSELPDKFLDSEDIYIEKIGSNAKRPQYVLSFPYCSWKIKITYDLKKRGYRIRKFMFDDGEGNILRGNRREYKPTSKVRRSRFEVEITPFMNRIIP